jgi:hypothetical protein
VILCCGPDPSLDMLTEMPSSSALVWHLGAAPVKGTHGYASE